LARKSLILRKFRPSHWFLENKYILSVKKQRLKTYSSRLISEIFILNNVCVDDGVFECRVNKKWYSLWV